MKKILLPLLGLLLLATAVLANTLNNPDLYAYNNTEKSITTFEGLKITGLPTGAVQVNNTYANPYKIPDLGEISQGYLVLKANVSGVETLFKPSDYAWNWNTTASGEDYNLIGTNDSGTLSWVQNYAFQKYGYPKITFNITNNGPQLDNVSFYIVIETNEAVHFNGTSYFTNTTTQIPANNENPILIDNAYYLDYSDLFALNYNLTEFYTGNGSEYGLEGPDKLVLTFRDHISLPTGASLLIDPTIASIPYTISSSGYYNLSANITGANGIQVSSGVNDTLIDCLGYKMTGTNTTGSYGIKAYNNSNLTITNCYINAYQYGINASLQQNLTVTNNNIFGYGGAAGGTGGNGATGSDSGSGYPCTNGGTGSQGGNGENAYGIRINNSTYANVSNNKIYSLIAGNSGTGGNGGNGGNGVWPLYHIGCNGGAGGLGGIGGNIYGLLLNNTNRTTISSNNITSSSSGTASNGGTGGNGGSSTVGMGEANAGAGGAGGAGGVGGTIYTIYFENSYLNTLDHNKYDQLSSKAGGNGGTGGGAGVCGCNTGCGYWCYTGGGGNGGLGGTVYGFYGLNSGNSTISYETINQSTSGNAGSGGSGGASVGWNCVGGGSNYCSTSLGGGGTQGNGGNVSKFYFINFDWGSIWNNNATSFYTLGTGLLSGNYSGFFFDSNSHNNSGYNNWGLFSDQGNNTVTNSSPPVNVSMTSPINKTYYSNEQPLTITLNITQGSFATYDAYYWLDGSRTAIGNIPFGTENSSLFSTTAGSHSIFVEVVNTTEEANSSSVSFSVSTSNSSGSTITGSVTEQSNFVNSNITDSNVWFSNFTNSSSTNSSANYSSVTGSSLNLSIVLNSTIANSSLSESNATLSTISGSTANSSSISGSTLSGSTAVGSTITNSTKTNSTITNSIVIQSINTNSTLDTTNETNSTTYNSFVLNSTLTNFTVWNANITSGFLNSGTVNYCQFGTCRNYTGPTSLAYIYFGALISITTDKSNYNVSQTVTITARATDKFGTSLPLVQMNLTLFLPDSSQAGYWNVTTDNNGNASVQYLLAATNQNGTYLLNANSTIYSSDSNLAWNSSTFSVNPKWAFEILPTNATTYVQVDNVAYQPLFVKNLGNQNVSITGYSDLTWVSVSPNPINLGVGQNTTVNAIVNSTGVPPGVDYNAMLTFNDPNDGLQKVALQIIRVTGPPTPNLVVSPTSADISVNVNATTTLNVSINNTGNAAGTNFLCTLTGDSAVNWITLGGLPMTTISPGENKTLSITVAVPSTEQKGTHNLLLTCSGDNTNQIFYNIRISARGPLLTITPGSISLTLPPGAGQSIAFLVQNIGDLDDSGVTCVPAGNQASWMTISPATPFPLAIQAANSVYATITVPAGTYGGTYTAAVSCAGSPDIQLPFSIFVTGAAQLLGAPGGGGPQAAPTLNLLITPASLSVNGILGKTVTASFTIKNIGASTTNVTMESNKNWIVFDNQKFQLAIGEEKLVTASFSPTSTIDAINVVITAKGSSAAGYTERALPVDFTIGIATQEIQLAKASLSLNLLLITGILLLIITLILFFFTKPALYKGLNDRNQTMAIFTAIVAIATIIVFYLYATGYA